MEKQTKKQLFWEIVRFLLVGSVSTIVDYTVFWLFDSVFFSEGTDSTFTLILATALGFSVGLMVSWFMSVRFVFRNVKDEKKSRSKKAFALFAVIGVIGLLLTEIGVVLLVAVLPEFSLFGTTSLLGTPWDKWTAKSVMTILVIVWNYVGRKLLIFKS